MRLHPERGGSHSVPGHYEKAWRHYGGWSEPWCCEARVDEDCEALGDLEQPHALQNPSFLSKYGLVVTMLATLLATCALASWWWLGVESSRESTKWTKFGEVPMTLRLSGVDCRRGDGNEDANGQYIYQGQTADGRPYYRHYDRVGMRGYTTTRNVMVPRVATTTRGECSCSHRQDPQLTQLQI